MILDISFNNYRLFKGANDLSFAADLRTRKLLSNSVCRDNKNVLKCLGLYGENNGGKTNVVALIGILQSVLLGEQIRPINRSVFGDSPISDFSITFHDESGLGWLRYEVSYDSASGSYPRERMSSIKFYDNGAPLTRVVFEKDVAQKVLRLFGEDKSMYLNLLPVTRPFLYSVKTDEGEFASLSPYFDATRALAASIEIIRMYNIPIKKTLGVLKGTDSKQQDFIRSFVKSADLAIEDFSYEKKPFSQSDEENDEIAEEALAKYVDIQDAFRLATTYNGSKVPSFFYDSSGTKKIEAIASYVYESIVKGKLLVVDELDNGLHFHLTRAIVSAFNNLANEKGQLLFTSHDLLLIDCKNLLRKDQIYFIERDKEAARLFCLKEATVAEGGPREGGALLKHYQKGSFGKVPMPSFIKEILVLRDEDDQRGER